MQVESAAMQDERRKKTYIIIAVVVAAVLLCACACAAVVGVSAALLIARREARTADWPALQEWLEKVPLPAVPGPEVQPLPTLPPGDSKPMPPFGPLPSGGGALVVQVFPDTPAEAAGLLPGDIITGIDGVPINADHPLPDVIAQYKPGDRVTVHFWRAGQEDQAQVTLAEHPDYAGRAYLGVRAGMMNPGMQRRGQQG
jgi:predicted metalloprotease with PDZ domain